MASYLQENGKALVLRRLYLIDRIYCETISIILRNRISHERTFGANRLQGWVLLPWKRDLSMCFCSRVFLVPSLAWDMGTAISSTKHFSLGVWTWSEKRFVCANELRSKGKLLDSTKRFASLKCYVAFLLHGTKIKLRLSKDYCISFLKKTKTSHVKKRRAVFTAHHLYLHQGADRPVDVPYGMIPIHETDGQRLKFIEINFYHHFCTKAKAVDKTFRYVKGQLFKEIVHDLCKLRGQRRIELL